MKNSNDTIRNRTHDPPKCSATLPGRFSYVLNWGMQWQPSTILLSNWHFLRWVCIQYGGTRSRSWLRHCATSQKVAGSIPDGVIGIIHWRTPSGYTMALGLTQPLSEMSTRNFSWGVKATSGYGWQPYHLHVLTVFKSGSLNFLEPSGPVQGCNGIALPVFIMHLFCVPDWCLSQAEHLVSYRTLQHLYSRRLRNIICFSYLPSLLPSPVEDLMFMLVFAYCIEC